MASSEGISPQDSSLPSLDFINTFLGIFIEKYLFWGIFRKTINNQNKIIPSPDFKNTQKRQDSLDTLKIAEGSS
jgi:hypothetical protein